MSRTTPLSVRTCVLTWLLFFLTGLASAQQTSATLAGVVKDRQDARIPGAKIVLINQAQGAIVREMTTEADGSFRIFPLNPATYTLTVEAAGFKKFEQRDIKLFANDRIALDNIILEVGAVTETVEVEAQVVQLEVESASRSGVVTGSQVINLALNGRNYMDLVKTTPGVVSFFNGEVAGVAGPGDIRVNGQRGTQNTLALDGVSNMDTGNNATQHTSLNVDAVAEMKIVTNSQTAEFGKSAGAAINVITKSGTQEFHGVGYWFHRNEGMNSNTWRNNYEKLPKRIYRFNYQGFNLGGPVFIPNTFNTDKTKLFFFVAHEWQEQLVPNSTVRLTLPTEAERNGDFSATHESNWAPVTIKDPTTGKPFPDNKIPQARWNSDGAKILRWYPLPNVTGQPDYNYQYQVSDPYPRRQLMLRGDWNINDRWRVFARWVRDQDDRTSYTAWGTQNIPFAPMHVGFPGRSAILNLTTTISPTLTNEFIFGPSWNRVDVTPNEQLTSIVYQKNFPLDYQSQMPFPKADRAGVLSNWRWGGVPNAPSTNYRGLPFKNGNTTFEISDNLSKVWGPHQFKGGFYIQRQRKDQTSFAATEGTFWFDRDVNNPGDTGWAFSNALIGTFRQFTQASETRVGMARYTNIEWYVSDTWKVRPDLTLDLGLRFYIIQPQYDARNQLASFNPALWDPAGAPLLYERARNPQGQTAARNPLTGAYLPASFVGALVPGTGKLINGIFANGMARGGYDGYPRGMIDSHGVLYAPRVGIAWKFAPETVFRLGGGIYYDRFQGNMIYDQLPNPPGVVQPNMYYGNLATIGSAQTVAFPTGMWSISKDGKNTSVYNWNAGIQRELPFGIMLDAAYVGSISRHLLAAYDVNRPGFGAAWLPQNQDPLVIPKFDGTSTLPVNFLRPYRGFAGINTYTFGGTSNYNGLQVAVNRRLAAGLQFGVAYTWSKALGTTGGDWDALHPTNIRMGNYAPLTFDRRHILVFNYIYTTPKVAAGGNPLDHWLGRAVFNNWTVSGITTLSSGAPGSVGFNISGLSGLNNRFTGDDTWGARVVPTGQDPYGSFDGEYGYLNPAAFKPPTRPSHGLESAARGYFYLPGSQNWDISIFKSFPFTDRPEQRFVQVRLEMFNAPNHPNFTNVGTTITFDQAGNVTNLPERVGRFGYGAVWGSNAGERIIQLGAKIYF